METRDVLADLGWSLRPRARAVEEASDVVAASSFATLCSVLGAGFFLGTESFEPSAAATWIPIGIGLAAAAVVALVAGWWSGRHVHPCRMVPLIFGLVFLAPSTLLLVDLAAVLVVHAALRPTRPRRVLADAAIRIVETGTAIVVFRFLAEGGVLNTPHTWGTLATGVVIGTLVRVGLSWWLDAGASVDLSDELPARAADAGATLLGVVLGIGAVGLTDLDDGGALLGVAGTIALMTGSLLTARGERRTGEVARLSRAQSGIADSVNRHAVLETAAEAISELVRADAVLLVSRSGATSVLAVDDEVRTLTGADLVKPLLDVLPGATGSILVEDGELQELRAVAMLGDSALHVIFGPVSTGDHEWTALAVREFAKSNPFVVSERRLLAQCTPSVTSALEMSDRLSRFERQARFDELTSLPSRANIEESIVALVESSRQSGSSLAVLLVDLNGFKEVNDTLGHQTGDVVLAEIGRRIGSFADEVDAVGRLGGDEFVLILSRDQGFDVDARAAEISRRLADAIAEPIAHGDLVLDISISVGVARFPDHGDTPGELIRAADVAMYAAKAKGQTITFYEGNSTDTAAAGSGWPRTYGPRWLPNNCRSSSSRRCPSRTANWSVPRP